MRIFIAKLFVFVLLINFFCFPFVQHAAENITNGQIVLTSSLTPAEQSPVDQQSKDNRELARWDIYEIIFFRLNRMIGFYFTRMGLLKHRIQHTRFSVSTA